MWGGQWGALKQHKHEKWKLLTAYNRHSLPFQGQPHPTGNPQNTGDVKALILSTHKWQMPATFTIFTLPSSLLPNPYHLLITNQNSPVYTLHLHSLSLFLWVWKQLSAESGLHFFFEASIERASLVVQKVKESTCLVVQKVKEDLDWITGLGRSPGEGNDNPLQLLFPGKIPRTEEPGWAIICGVAKSQTCLSGEHSHS